MEPLPYYKWHWRDYRANRRVQRMCWQAKGLYRELLDEFWAEGSLSLDHSDLADVCGCSLEEFEVYWPQIKGCWEETPDGYINAKMDTVRTGTDSVRVANAKNGRAGAVAKLANAKHSPASAKRPSGERHIAEQGKEEQSRVSKTTSSHPEPSVAGKHPDMVIYEAFPRKEGKGAALEAIRKAVARLVKGEAPHVPMVKVEAQRYLMRRVLEYERSPVGRQPDRTKIPHPATWFNQKRYDDDQANWHQTEASSGNHSKTAGNLDAAAQAIAFLEQADRDRQASDELLSEAGSGDQPGNLGDLRAGSIEV